MSLSFKDYKKQATTTSTGLSFSSFKRQAQIPKVEPKRSTQVLPEKQLAVPQKAQTKISSVPQSTIQKITSKLPKPIKEVGQNIKEGLFGYERERSAGLTLDTPFTARLSSDGFLPFLGRPQGEKIAVLERSLINRGTDPKRAGEIATLDVLRREKGVREIEGRKKLAEELDKLNLSEKEERARLVAEIAQGVGSGLDVLGVLPMGSIKVSAAGAKGIAGTKNLNKIVSIFKAEVPEITDEAAQSFAKLLVNVDKVDDVQRVINRTNLALQEAKNAPVTPKIAPQKGVKVAEDLTIGRYLSDEQKAESLNKAFDTLDVYIKKGDTRGIAGESSFISKRTGIEKELVPLASEARKYKSAEEFVEAQGTIYRGGTKLDNSLVTDQGVSFSTSKDVAKRFADEKPGNILEEAVISPKAKVISIQDIPKEFRNDFDAAPWAKQNGYDVIDFNGAGFADEIRVINPDVIQTKSQLTDIWERANNLPELPKATSQTIQETPNIENITPQRSQPLPQQVERQNLPQGRGQVTPTRQELSTISYDGSLPQTSKVVNNNVKPSINQATYEANRTNQKPSKFRQAIDSLKSSVGSIGETTDKVLGTISTRLKNIDPSLKKGIRDFEFKLGLARQKDRKAVEPFLKKVTKIDPVDYIDLDLALKNGDANKINEIVSKYGLQKEFNVVKNTLDDIWERANQVGYDIGYEKNYFPRMIEDSAGLLEYLQKGDDWSIIDEAIKAKELKLGRYLDTNEKANVVNTLLRGYGTSNITLSETGAMKARRIDIVDDKLNQFYRDSIASLLRYVDETNDAIEARRFFGKAGKSEEFGNINDSIGSYILNLMADGKVKPSQEIILRDILQARFSPVGTSGAVRVYKNLSYIDTMGSFTSAITQIGDLAFALYKGGATETGKAFGKALVGKSDITRKDLGIEKIAQEFEDSSRSANLVSRVFKIVGLEKMDALGKETVINASIGRMRKQAEKPTESFIKKLEAVFGNNRDELTQVISDLKEGRTTENVKLLAFNELLDVQPVALSEMPEVYLKGGNGRIFYMLKTYTIKLFDVYRNEIFQEIKSGNKVQGIKNLIYLTGALVAMNATADEIKDLLLGRETSLKDRTVDNILKLAGFSKFTIYKARQEGIGSAVARTILPPFKFIDSLYKDIAQQKEVSELETIQSIPVGGKLYYWWFGKGASKKEKASGGGTVGGLDFGFGGNEGLQGIEPLDFGF